VNCAAWALAELAGLPAGTVLDLLRPYAERGWAEYDAAGLVIGVTMPEVAVALLPSLGFRVASYRGTGPPLAARWARWSARWFPGRSLLLIADGRDGPGGHVLLARDGLLLDNGNSDGLPGLDHPYAAARVRVALRLYDAAEVRRDADARRWPVVGEHPITVARSR
jgi:hypothetical protein